MIADALNPDRLARMPWLRPEDALKASLAAARARLPVNQPASRMDGQSAIVRGVEARGLDIWLVVATNGGPVETLCGEWERASL